MSEVNPSTAFKKILLLEDEDIFANVIQAYLEESDFKVIRVPNGVEGLKKVMSEDFDIILTDMLMPNLAGDMFYTAVERAKPHFTKRFIFMSGHRGDPKWDSFVRRIGGVMLWKPFELHVLLETITGVLKKNASAQANQRQI
jgi:two-component system nitrogen regulation response regulator NtrX